MTAANPAVGAAARATLPGGSIVRPRRVTRWHVSPAVDLLGYAFSWVVLALPLYLLLGSDVLRIDEYRGDAFAFIVIGVLLIDVHRHFTFPYVYLNRRLRQTFPLRFWLLPALCLALLTQLPFLARSPQPLYPAEVAAILGWGVLLLQLLRTDRIGGALRRRAFTAALIGLGVAAVLSSAARGPSPEGWVWLLCAAGASFSVVRAGSSDPGVGAPAGQALPSTLDTWIPLAAMAALIVGAAATSGVVTVNLLVSALVLVYVLWLAFHTVTQKYGILRIYSAKSGIDAKVPRWVDRALVWCWVPMVIIWTIVDSPQIIVTHLDRMTPGTSKLVYPILELFTGHSRVWLALASALIAGCFGAFGYYEWKIHRLRNVPRLAFAAGTGLFYASLFAIGIVGLYVAFAATHCIEYMTFIWALQRQRFPGYDPEAPVLSRIIQWPIAYYGGVALFVAAVFFLARYSYFYLGAGPETLDVFGAPIYAWAFWYSIMQAFLHFYYDGFLWKMRPELTRAL